MIGGTIGGGGTTGAAITTIRTVSRSESAPTRDVEATTLTAPGPTAVMTPPGVTVTVAAASDRHTTTAEGSGSPRWSVTFTVSARLALGCSVSTRGVA
jgi:hypothetical protein